MTIAFPTERETFDALRAMGRMLEREWAYLVDSTYHFCLGDDWTIAVTPESARRLRLELASRGSIRSTVWNRVDDHSRLEEQVIGLVTQVRALVG